MDEGGKKVADQPVRVVCRYANGLMQSSVARGQSLNGDILRVLTREQYEPGITVTVMAAFLDKTQTARVTAYRRTAEAGVFLMELLLRPVPGVIAPAAETAQSSGERFRQGASALAKRLEDAGWCPYYEAVFERATASERALFLAATEIAVFKMVAEYGLADLEWMKARIGRGSR